MEREDNVHSTKPNSEDLHGEANSPESSANDDASNQSKEEMTKGKPCLLPSNQHDGSYFLGVPASPPQVISVEDIKEAADTFSDLALAHEIAINDAFVLEPTPKRGLEAAVTKVLHQAFWDILQAQLNETPPDYSQAFILLNEVKEFLLDLLLPQHDNIRNQINAKLDLELIKQQVKNNVLDIQEYANFIVAVMERLCAPSRDEKIQELKTLKGIVPLYKGILETLSLMKLDMVNFTMQQMRPHVQHYSIEYEREKFKKFLDALAALSPPVDGLALTKEWFKDICEKNKKLLVEKKISHSELITKAFVEIFLWKANLIFPETLQMDKGRYLDLVGEFTNVVLAASILLMTYTVVGESIQGVSSLKLRLKEQVFILLKNDPSIRSEEKLKELLLSINAQVIKEVNECLVLHGFPALCDSKATVISAQIQEIGSPQHNIRKLINNRILEFMENVLNSPDLASVKIPPGLSAFRQELTKIAAIFSRLVKYNRGVFGDYYSDFISMFMQEVSN